MFTKRSRSRMMDLVSALLLLLAMLLVLADPAPAADLLNQLK